MVEHFSDIVQSHVLKSISNGAKSIDKSTIELGNGSILIFRSSKSYDRTGFEDYFFGLPKRKFEEFPRERLFVIFACGRPTRF